MLTTLSSAACFALALPLAVARAVSDTLLSLLNSPTQPSATFALPTPLGPTSKLAAEHAAELAWLRDRLGADGAAARDSWLLRMLSSCDWDLQTALRRCEASLALRREVGYDAIAAFVRAHPAPEEWPHGEAIMRLLPRYIARTGAGVVVVAIEDCDYELALKCLSPEAVRQFWLHKLVYLLETLADRDEAAGNIDGAIYMIVDSTFTTSRQGMPLQWVARMMPGMRDAATLAGYQARARGRHLLLRLHASPSKAPLCSWRALHLARPLNKCKLVARAYFRLHPALLHAGKGLGYLIQPQTDPDQAAALSRIFEPKPLPVSLGGFS
ncbi:hypothetical protein EMIHUDRAFT_435233 [Emiliania huxleyi CCMP1516]|uniref:CRAL-TRIO domain-containing protein n=2 Tax=Emiliania huxleyi TaxID=2903 RepID=A0A0D3JQU4_EMIH1|nr:hypothetical protein EMIHUDRAFT_435233 [Emiliania huxleyi CCMP1516]EOD25879.1 hypothetical protein EMIHUDRAFT_435233 [Emiliania huxleyi CCMP1516]|eukprot:XP_005778308.1 hypothetical protein EMIHUDRAFT_435233 [Emiliania huxleyi CCMP1516]